MLGLFVHWTPCARAVGLSAADGATDAFGELSGAERGAHNVRAAREALTGVSAPFYRAAAPQFGAPSFL